MNFGLLDIIWFIFILSALFPMLQRQALQKQRLRILHRLERRRGTRVIVLIHRQEALSFLGVPIFRFIDINDSEEVLRAIRLTPDDMPIDLVLHTPGGLVLATEQIASAIKRHPGKVTVFVPHYAMSGGTLLALAADEIVMDENAVLGPVDPQLGEYPAASLVKVVREKDRNRVEDRTLILADVAEKAIGQMRSFVQELLEDKMPEEKARELAALLSEGTWTHDYPIKCGDLKRMGLKVSNQMPPEIYALMRLYPQSGQRRPSVQYIPVPYDHEGGPNDRGK